MTALWKSAPFEVKSVDPAAGRFEGTAACFGSLDLGGDIIANTAYDKHLNEFRAKGVVRDEHEHTTGKITDARVVQGKGLRIGARVSDTPHGRDQMILLRDRVVTHLAIGHYVVGKRHLASPRDVKSYWDSVGYAPDAEDVRRSARGARLITEAKPVEVSTTWNPMSDRCSITGVKADAPPAGLTFTDHSQDALAALEEFEERATRLFAKRADPGRALPPRHVARFRRVRDQLLRLAGAPGKVDATDLYVDFLASCVRAPGSGPRSSGA